MPRFALRNQRKIEGAFCREYLNLLLRSLKAHFDSHDEIEELTYENEKHKVIHVENVQLNTDGLFEFYMIRKTYDVYLLAYKSAIS